MRERSAAPAADDSLAMSAYSVLEIIAALIFSMVMASIAGRGGDIDGAGNDGEVKEVGRIIE